MIKKLHFKVLLLMATLVFGVGNVWGDTESAVDLSKGTFSTDHITWSLDDAVTITQSKGSSSNAVNSSYISAPRVYKGQVLSFVAGSGYVIKSISITYNGSYSGNSMTAGTVMSGNTVTDNTTDVSRTWASTSGGTHVVSSVSSEGLSAIYIQNVASASNTQLRITAISVTYASTGGSPTVATPTFTPAEGTYVGTQSVTIACATDGAAIHYTTDGTDPTSSSATYSSAISVSSTQTIKAIAVKDGMTDSDVASATYTILTEVPGYTLDFEADDLICYTDWTMANVEQGTSDITAHGGTYYGTTGGKASASIVTKEQYANPGLLKFYISKLSKNTTESTWKVEVSSDGSSWTLVGDEINATSMSKGDWVEVTRDLSSYSNVYVRISYAGSTAVRAIDDILLASVKSVESVSLNKSTATIEIGDTEQLSAIFDPVDASNQAVTWESSDDAIATVSSTGLVTAVAKGTATITVTTDDGGKTAECVVSVVNRIMPIVTLDFTDNTDWAFPTSKEAGPDDFTDGQGHTITLNGNGEGYYFTDDVLLLGKSGATLTLPAFPFNVSKIKVLGTSTGAADVTFNIYVGDDAVSTSATNAKEDHVFEIAAAKQAAGTVYVLKVTNANNTRISGIEIYGYQPVTISDACFATYCSDYALDFSSVTGLTAYTATLAGSTVSFHEVTTNVPAGTGLLLQGAARPYNIPVVPTSSTDVDDNVLVGTVTGTTIHGNDAGTDFFVLTKKNENVGFYRVTATDYQVRANSAYLAVAKGSAKGFIPVDGTTAIELVDTTNEVAAPAYNLQGQRVSNGYKGVVIVNGKKVINK